MRIPNLLAVATIATASFVQANPVSRNNKSSGKSTPWPEIPQQATYKQPDGPVYVFPSSVVKGVTSKSVAGSGGKKMTFNQVGDTYTLDFGVEYAGKPHFEIASLKGSYAQIEVKYTESYQGLLSNYSDGPYAFSNGLSNTFRVETFNITNTGNLTSYFVQGGQRWKSIKLIKGDQLVISRAGFVSSVSEAPLNSYPGYFASSNQSYTDIWNLGPRTMQLVCFPPYSQPATWDFTSDGAYVRGQKPASSSKGINYENYTLAFETKIDYGGTGWRLDMPLDAITAAAPYLVLTSEYPEGSFANYNESLVPPNTLVLGRGWSLQNQTTLPGYTLAKFPVQMNVTEKTWHNIETDSVGNGLYRVRLNGKQIAEFNITTYPGNANPFIPGGKNIGFALGPWQDQAAWFRDVKVVLNNGTVAYSNPLTDKSILPEFGVDSNNLIMMSDSGKRDRYSWLGDRLQSSRSVEVVGEMECVWGPAESQFSRQDAAGRVPSNTLFSQLDQSGVEVRTQNLDPILNDFDGYFVELIYNYYLRSGNTTFLEKYYGQLQKMVNFYLFFAMDPSGYASSGQATSIQSTVTRLLVYERMSSIAQVVGDANSTTVYAQKASADRTLLENSWNSTIGAYTIPGTGDFTYQDIAAILLADVGPKQRQQTMLNSLPDFYVPGGYSVTQTQSSGGGLAGVGAEGTPVNPNSESSLLEALGLVGDAETAQSLLDRTWGPMVARTVNFTAGYWEYLDVNGTIPGQGLFTGQSHFWGGFPTAFLTEYVLGVRPVSAAFETFVMAPLAGFKTEWVHGRVPTPYGSIFAAWGFGSNGKLQIEITAPSKIQGTVVPPFNGSYTVNGGSAQSGNLTVVGGKGKYYIVQQ